MGGGNGQLSSFLISPPTLAVLIVDEPVAWLWVLVGSNVPGVSVAGRRKRGLYVMRQAVQIAIEGSRCDQKYVIRIVSKRRES